MNQRSSDFGILNVDANCGRICMHRKKINISIVMAGQRLAIKEVDDGIWLVSFMRYDLGYPAVQALFTTR
jgi:hypothetical protein